MLDKDANIISQIDQRPWHVFTCHDCASAYKKSPPNSRILPLVSGCIPKWSLGTSNPNQKLSFPLDSFFVREMHFADLFFTDLFFKVRDWILVWFRGVNGVDGGSKKLEIKRDDLPRTWGIWLTNPTPSRKRRFFESRQCGEQQVCDDLYVQSHLKKQSLKGANKNVEISTTDMYNHQRSQMWRSESVFYWSELFVQSWMKPWIPGFYHSCRLEHHEDLQKATVWSSLKTIMSDRMNEDWWDVLSPSYITKAYSTMGYIAQLGSSSTPNLGCSYL